MRTWLEHLSRNNASDSLRKGLSVGDGGRMVDANLMEASANQAWLKISATEHTQPNIGRPTTSDPTLSLTINVDLALPTSRSHRPPCRRTSTSNASASCRAG